MNDSAYILSVRQEFPILKTHIGKNPLIYFDNGASSQKPQTVIGTIHHYYTHENANIHRGVHYLSQHATEKYELAREKIAKFLNAEFKEEIIFTSGTTESINLVASSFGKLLSEGDEIVITQMEHHSNIVPWQMLAEEKKLKLKYIPINLKGELVFEQIESIINSKTKLVAITHVSNSLGTINPINDVITKAHHVGAKVLIDAAQSLQHFKVDVQKLNCDFLVFSGHKIFGPTGTGILYGKKSLLDEMPPYRGGGDMIKTVTMEKTTYNDLPHKFEAGTPHIAGGIALGAAIEWYDNLNHTEIEKHEGNLLKLATDELKKIDGIKFYGEAENKCSLISFLVEGLHPYDVGTLLNQQGIAVRTGHHCAQPVMDFFQIPGTIRASFAFYNTLTEVEQFVLALKRSIEMLK